MKDTEAAARYGVSRPTIWRWAKKGVFPKPIKLGGGSIRWRLSDLDDWEQSKRQNDSCQSLLSPTYAFLAMPYEFLTDDFLKDPIMMRFVVWMIKRISLYPCWASVKGMSKGIHLDPFEFIFRKKICSLGAGISPKNAYTRIKQLVGLGYIKKVTSKTSSTYSVFVLEINNLMQR